MPSGLTILKAFYFSNGYLTMVLEKLHPAVFLDRDGTINKEVGYIDTPDKIQPIPRSDEAIKSLREMGYRIIVVSNQSGVARGYFDENAVELVNKKVIELFSMKGAAIDAIYYCPHHPKYGDENYRIDCQCRKPKPGMILGAAEEHGIDISKSIMIGDKYTDVLTGKNLNMFSVLLLTGFGKKEFEKIKTDKLEPVPDFVSENIYEAVQHIRKNFNLR